MIYMKYDLHIQFPLHRRAKKKKKKVVDQLFLNEYMKRQPAAITNSISATRACVTPFKNQQSHIPPFSSVWFI